MSWSSIAVHGELRNSSCGLIERSLIYHMKFKGFKVKGLRLEMASEINTTQNNCAALSGRDYKYLHLLYCEKWMRLSREYVVGLFAD